MPPGASCVGGGAERKGSGIVQSSMARLRSGASSASGRDHTGGSDGSEGVPPAIAGDGSDTRGGEFGSTATMPSMGELSLRTEAGLMFEAGGAILFHQSPTPLPSPIWPAFPGTTGDAAGADAPGAPKAGGGKTGALFAAAPDAAPDPPKTSGRNGPGTANGPKFCGASGAKCSGGSVGSAGGFRLGEACKRERAGGTKGAGPFGPPIDVGNSAPGIGMPGEGCSIGPDCGLPGCGTLPGRDGWICGERGDDVVGPG